MRPNYYVVNVTLNRFSISVANLVLMISLRFDIFTGKILQMAFLPLALLDQLPHDQLLASPGQHVEDDSAADDDEDGHQPELPGHVDDNDGDQLQQRIKGKRIYLLYSVAVCVVVSSRTNDSCSHLR